MSFGREPLSLAPAMAQVSCFGGWRSSSRFIALTMRLTAESWSLVSRIWKPCGSAAIFQWARRKRLQRPWKVPTHMPRTGMASMASSRTSISFAALLVKVTAITPPGESWPVSISQAMRVVSTRVLPEPAPARMRGRLGRQGHRGELLGVQPFEQARRALHFGRKIHRSILGAARSRAPA